MANVDLRIEKWKKRLLDLGKRNRLINYSDTKCSNIKIISPNLADLYTRLVVNEEPLAFSYSSQNELDEVDSSTLDFITKGDIETDRTIKEQQKIVGNFRGKTKIAAEEQGVNILYLSVGFLRWVETATLRCNTIERDKCLVSPERGVAYYPKTRLKFPLSVANRFKIKT